MRTFEHFPSTCILSDVSKLTRFVVLTVLAVWGLAAMHCKLEVLPGLEFLECCCNVETNVPSPKDCENDGCGTIEDGSYRSEEESVSIPQPVLVRELLAELIEAPLPVFQPSCFVSAALPPELLKVWQFNLRTALLPRAPSSIA